MSFFMDGVGFDKLIKFAAGIVKKETEKSDFQSDSSMFTINAESDNFELSKNYEKRRKEIEGYLEDAQKGVSILDSAEKGIDSIKGYIEKIGNLAKSVKAGDLSQEDLDSINSAIKENLEAVEKTVENTKFDDKKLLDGSSYNNIRINIKTDGIINISSGLKEISLKELGLPESKDFDINSSDDAKALEDKVQKAVDELKSRQDKIFKDKIDVEKTVNDLYQTSSIMSQVDPDMNTKLTQDLKQSIVNGMLINPEEVMKAQIKNIDEDMILALISIQ